MLGSVGKISLFFPVNFCYLILLKKTNVSVLLKCTIFNGLKLLLATSSNLFCIANFVQLRLFGFIYSHVVEVCTSILSRLYLICTRIIVFDIHQF